MIGPWANGQGPRDACTGGANENCPERGILFIEISSYEVQTNIVKFLCPCASTGLDHGTLLICSPVLLVIGWRGRVVAAHIRRRRSH